MKTASRSRMTCSDVLTSWHGSSENRYREALADYVFRRDPRSVTNALDEIVEEIGPGTDGWSIEAGRHALARSEW